MNLRREILFRGKHQTENIWVYGYYMAAGRNHYIVPVGGLSHVPVQPQTVGMFTGYADSSGNKIFEDDYLMDAANLENGWWGLVVFSDRFYLEPEHARDLDELAGRGRAVIITNKHEMEIWDVQIVAKTVALAEKKTKKRKTK